ncbi:hypothetical protein BOTCAL_0405g00030 [Botryotinia calthae]|uniref:Uncharacterized protein n=1 Tax=Botryotinia calthae TaxID=38488 RepID=A0A4Y8CQ07_9HELO|nr:hypothetical protein BOTCAL_0405g00030 [Botryotinia calthae]
MTCVEVGVVLSILKDYHLLDYSKQIVRSDVDRGMGWKGGEITAVLCDSDGKGGDGDSVDGDSDGIDGDGDGDSDGKGGDGKSDGKVMAMVDGKDGDGDSDGKSDNFVVDLAE